MKHKPHISSAYDCYLAIREPALASKPWLMTDRRTVSFGELAARIESIAALLRAMQVAPGERVVVASRDDAESALLFVALICNGIAAVNLDPDTSAERAQSLIKSAAPAIVVADRELSAKWSLASMPARLIDLVASSAGAGKLLGKLFGKVAQPEGLHALLTELAPIAPPAHLAADTLAYILFTSGTTDQPKGVCISHRALFAHLSTLSKRYGYEDASRILNTLMLSHADGMIQGPVIGFYNQATVYRPMQFQVTAVEPLLDAIYRLRITHMVAVPTMLALILRLGLEQRDAFQGGDFRLLISCGAQLDSTLWEDFESTFRTPLVNVYGLTETVVGGVFSGPSLPSRMPGSIGMPEDCELRVVAADGSPVAPGDAGELWMRGDLLMSGYFGAPDLTAEVLRDGWFSTGDVARQDEQGRYWIVGRAKISSSAAATTSTPKK